MEICEVINNNKYSSQNNSEYLYRGQSNKEWELIPSIFRSNVDNKKEQGLYRDIRQWNIEQFSSGDFLKDSCNMQHYGIPTRLIDWTSNTLHALYFAVTGSNEKNKDGEVLCVDIDKIHDIDSNEYKQINDFLMYRYEGNNFERLESNGVNKLLTEFSLDKKRYMFFKTKYFNDRIKRQQGYFSIYIDITEEEANDVRKRLLELSIDDIIKNLKKLDTGLVESDYENIRKIILKDVVSKYNKYTEMNSL